MEDTIARAAAADPVLRDHPPVVRYDGFACEGSVVDAGEALVQELFCRLRVGARERAAPGGDDRDDGRAALRPSRHPRRSRGPRAERIHGIDERVSLSSLAEVARVWPPSS